MNQAPITGESALVEKAAGDRIFAGTVNGHGALEVRVEKLADDTTLAKIIHQVEEAQARRAPAQAFIDRFARYYTPSVLGHGGHPGHAAAVVHACLGGMVLSRADHWWWWPAPARWSFPPRWPSSPPSATPRVMAC